MATDYKALGKRISNARKQAGITQEALGEQLNMTRKHISVIESAIKRPSLDALVDIANALDVSTDEMPPRVLQHSQAAGGKQLLHGSYTASSLSDSEEKYNGLH